MLCAGYLIAAYIVLGAIWCVRRTTIQINYMNKVFDAVTFATSTLVIGGIVDKGVLALLGDLKPFLIIAALCGIVHCLHALFKA